MRAMPAVVAAVAFLTGCGAASDAPSTIAPAAGAERLSVDASWLAANADDADLVVLNVGPDEAAFAASRVPGARFLPLSAVVIEVEGIPNELPPLADVRAALEQRGVGDASRVVVYGEPLHAARAFLALDVIGHSRTALLDGGIAAWREHGGGIETGPAAAARAGSLRAAPHPERLITTAELRDRLGDPDLVLIDTRPEAQYAEARIPGARSLFWQRTLVSDRDPRLLPDDELRALFREAGVRDGDTLVIYCRTGMQAGFLYYVARLLGYDARIYDGSLVEWTALSLPVER